MHLFHINPMTWHWSLIVLHGWSKVYFHEYFPPLNNFLPWIVSAVFRRLMKGKFDAYVLWPLTKKFQKRIVSAETIRGNTVVRNKPQIFSKCRISICFKINFVSSRQCLWEIKNQFNAVNVSVSLKFLWDLVI